jgi:hypothetical protein
MDGPRESEGLDAERDDDDDAVGETKSEGPVMKGNSSKPSNDSSPRRTEVDSEIETGGGSAGAENSGGGIRTKK